MDMKPAELEGTEFTLLGSFYTHDQFEVTMVDDAISIIPKRHSTGGLFFGLVVMTFLAGPLFGLAVWAGLQHGTPPSQVIGALTPFGLLAVVGPVAFASYRSRYLETFSPLVACDLKSGTVTVRGGRQHHRQNEVVCFVALAEPNDEHRRHAEIQLVTHDSNGLHRSLVLTSLDGAIALHTGLAELLRRYCLETKIPGYMLRNGVLTRIPR